MRVIRNFVAGIVLLGLAAPALAQSGRTLKIVNPFPAGGTADIWARLLGEQIGRDRGISVVIENRPGGGTVIATEAVSHAPPDGNTVLVVGNSFTINPNIRKLNKVGVNHICFAVDDLDSEISKLAAAGIRLRNEVMDFHGRKLVFVYGPEDITVELAEWH